MSLDLISTTNKDSPFSISRSTFNYYSFKAIKYNDIEFETRVLVFERDLRIEHEHPYDPSCYCQAISGEVLSKKIHSCSIDILRTYGTMWYCLKCV